MALFSLLELGLTMVLAFVVGEFAFHFSDLQKPEIKLRPYMTYVVQERYDGTVLCVSEPWRFVPWRTNIVRSRVLISSTLLNHDLITGTRFTVSRFVGPATPEALKYLKVVSFP